MTRLLLLLLLLAGCVEDLDGDGSPAADDCNDADGAVHPGADEVCNGVDDDCVEGIPADELDLDGDGVSSCAGDCDDANARVSPEGVEVCDQQDNDCNGEVDEGFVDSDANGVLDCLEVDGDGDGYRPWQGDCDDTNAAIHPGASEVCNGLDDDCDGYSNADPLLEGDSDGDGHFTCTDCDDDAPANFPGNPEICDGLDNDCDGDVDEGMESPWYADDDGDGYGAGPVVAQQCVGPEGTSATADDCDDDEPVAHPTRPEDCDGIDNDCDGAIDEGVLLATWPDNDGDGYGVALNVAFECEPSAGRSVFPSDCNDIDDTVCPGAPEICDRVDDDCDGVLPLIEQDLDVDGMTPCEGDCDDGTATTTTGALERCNDIDDDCDGILDNAPHEVLCPPPFGVEETECVTGPPSQCEMLGCQEGYWAFDTDYDNGCECDDDDGGPTCDAAFDFGPVQVGDLFQHAGRLPEPQLEDWFLITFPASGRPGGGTPSVSFATNPGGDYRLRVLPACGEDPFACGDPSLTAAEVDSWSQTDDLSDILGFTSNAVAWPEQILVRVTRDTGGSFCEDYVLEVSR